MTPPTGARWRFLALVLAVAAVMGSAVGPVADSVSAVDGSRAQGRSPWMDIARMFSSIVPRSLIELVGGGGQAISSGNDGRLTILLLGADSRTGAVGRTDTIMLFSIKGNSISIASIPRDTARIPNPAGGTYSARVNALFRQLGASEFMRVMENALDIEIDHYALVTFFGFHGMVDEYDPVPINTRQVRDTQYWDDPNLPKGVYFPAQSGYELYAWQPGAPSQLCNGLWQTQGTGQQNWCRRAMPYVRSRKGSSDFARATRQQDFVMASIRRVLNRGLGGMVGAAQNMEGAGQLRTDIPVNAANAQDLFNRLSGAGLAVQEVLSPPRFSTHIPGGTGYELDLAEVRSFMRQYFGGSGTPPPPTSPPTPPGATPTPFRTPSPTPFRTPSPAPTLPPGVTPSPAPTLPPGVTPSPAPTLPPGVTPSPAPTLPPGVTPSPSPSLAPGQTPLPTPTLAPGQTPLPTPTLAPGQTPLPTPTLAPGQTAAPTAVAGGATPEPGATLAPGATPSPIGAVVPTPVPGSPTDPGAATSADNSILIAVALLGALIAAAAVFLGYRRMKAPPPPAAPPPPPAT